MKITINIILFLSISFSILAQKLDDVQKQYFLYEHNIHRQVIGVPELTWSESLENEAQEKVDEIVANPISTDIYNNKYGVNFYKSAKIPTAKEVVTHWIKGQKYFHGDTITETDLYIFGSYTQIIWSQTTTIGCAHAITKGGTHYLICLYDPKGNIVGQKPF